MPRLLLLLLTLLPLVRLTAGQTVQQPGYWARAYLRMKLTDRWTFHSELGERRRRRPNRQWQLITHQSLHYRMVAPLDMGVGVSSSRQPATGGEAALRKWWGFADATLTTSLSARVRLQNRLRLEQRWLEPAAAEPPGPWQVRGRLRYRLQADWQIAAGWKARMLDEVLFYPDGFDQNRAYAGLE